MTVYGLRRGVGSRRRRAHLCLGPLESSLCGRPINMTANVPFGRPACKDCLRIAVSHLDRKVGA